MRPFELHQANSLDEVISLASQLGDEAHLMAGGTSMVLLMNQGLIEPAHIIALRNVPELRGVQRLPDGGLEIRAMASHRQVEVAPEVGTYCPALAETFAHVATIRIRNQATVGGNLAHADPAQDPPPMLIALDGRVVLKSASGERTLPLDEFFVDYFETALQPGEVLTSVQLPPLPAGTQATYVKFLPRTQDDYATVAVAATLRLDADGRCQDARVALGAAGTVPIHARVVEDALRGQTLSDQRLSEAAALVTEVVDPLDDTRGSASYKRDMARVWTERALRRLRDEAQGQTSSGRDGARA
jgi:carbon-monoxide dehydrogenase medium subunit